MPELDSLLDRETEPNNAINLYIPTLYPFHKETLSFEKANSSKKSSSSDQPINNSVVVTILKQRILSS